MADEWSKTKVFRLVLRIATVGFSIYSGIKTATASQTMRDGSTVTSSDYPSFQYSTVADLVSAILQGVVILLEVVGQKKNSKLVDMIDKVVLALMSSSTALLFAVDEITSCGPGRRSVCNQAREFCSGIRQASHLSIAGTVSVASAVYIRRAPAALTLAAKLFRRLIHPGDGPVIIHRPPSPPPPPPIPPFDDPPVNPDDKPPPNPPPGPHKDNPDKPSSKGNKKEKHNLELLVITASSPGPSHNPTELGLGLRLSVSRRYEDEDAEAGWNY